MKLEAIIEKAEDSIWGRIEGASDFLPTTSGKSVMEVLDNLMMLIEDYLEHEGIHDKWLMLYACCLQSSDILRPQA